jgi:NhaA family Na+:H+ antiporter
MERKLPVDFIRQPIQKFIQNEKAGGVVLGISVIIALILANSPLAGLYHRFFEYEFGFSWNGASFLKYNLHHWINDGLMAIFFFVVGLELKREIVAGELSNPKKALLPIVAALGGMIVPAAIYYALNAGTETAHGWGIPMATDIAFALGVLYLLGNRIPLSLKVFLTALAIVDDLGAVVVIALFYTSDISLTNLLIGILFLAVMVIGNKMGVRSIVFYGILGIGGVWTAFLLSGVHATIAAVLAAFTVPANVRLKESYYIKRIQGHLDHFKQLDPNDAIPTLTNEQLQALEAIHENTQDAMTPLQKLEHAMHPLVTFVIIPIFAIANAGVGLNIEWHSLMDNNVALGVGLGLLVGKVVGVVGFTLLFIKLGIAPMPQGMTVTNLFGLGLLAAIGFTMSLFVTELAFVNPDFKAQAKIGIFAASIVGGLLGYILLSRLRKKSTQ